MQTWKLRGWAIRAVERAVRMAVRTAAERPARRSACPCLFSRPLSITARYIAYAMLMASALDHIPKYDIIHTRTRVKHECTRAHKNRLTNARTANAPSRRAAVPSSIDGLPTTRYVTPVTAPRGPPGPSRLKIRLARPACSLLQRTTPRPAHDRRSHVHPASAPASPGDCTGAPGHRHARGSDAPRRVATPRLDLAELGIICLRSPWRWQRRRCWQRRGAAFDALGVRHAQFLGDGTERPADRIHLAVEPADR